MAIVGTQDLKFHTHSLQRVISAEATILTENILYNDLPEKVLSIKSDTIRDGFDIVSEQYAQKVITINGWLISDTGEHLRELIDTFKGYLRPKEKALDIETSTGSGSYVRWVATVRAISIPETFHTITQKPFTAEFLCQPFGIGKKVTAEKTGQKTSPLEKEIINDGTYKSLPTITIHLVSGADIETIKFENDTEDWIKVETTFGNNKDLIINCEEETVTYEGENVDFTGVFPPINMGTKTVTVTVEASDGYEYDLTVVFNKRYL